MACTTAPLPQDVAAFLHLVKGVDMVIWCSQEFSANEHRIWATAPQTLHDHSFLVLTSDRAEVRHTLVNGLFRAVHRVDLRGASSAISTKNERLWQASGLADLQSALLQQVEQGIEADVDHAQAFLVQFEKTQAQEARRPVIAPRDNTHRIRRALQEADHLLAACGDDLNRRATRQVLTPPEILSCCADTARALQDMLAKDKTIRPEIRKLVAEGEKAIRSLVDSTATTATLDAITVLLQMRREIGTGADSAA
ncbi:hypothetical protein [Thalassovita sp.]|uniref:hypothetical protein n=1 Tax=Thalassovita sp. TaxID=1979401 RepID=UPI0029DE7C8C|nr:hypothetical protein [Thalassovita sp.]